MDELRSILDKKKSIGDKLKLAWYFDKWYEKLILVAFGLLAMSKIWGWLIK